MIASTEEIRLITLHVQEVKVKIKSDIHVKSPPECYN